MDAEGVKLRILLLGPPVVYYGEEPLRIQRRVLRSLLFYLAGQSEPVGRAVLMDLFWPDEDEEEARRRLREALSKLRTQLPHPSILVAEQDLVRLDPQQTYVDVLEYQALIDQVRPYLQRQSTTPLPEAIYQQMYKAVNLWRSPEYMSGVALPSTEGLDRWMSLQVQALDYTRQSLLETLADHAATSGDLEDAVYWVRRALETDDENPDLYQRLISWLRDLGKRSEALSACEQVRKIYNEHGLGSLPPAIAGLCRQIREEADLPAQQPPAPWHNTLTLQLPFVGRKKLMADLRHALQRGGVELIWGEAGAGKSRLTFEFYQSLEPAPRLLLAAGHAHLMELPYQPMLDMLRHAVTLDEWKQLDSVWADTLSLLLPELLTLRPDARRPENLDEASRRQAIAEAFLQVFLILARRQRLLLFLDDAQWADPDTFSLLAYLLDHKLFARHGLLVIAARPEEPNQAFSQFLSQSQVPWMVHQSQLELLVTDEIAELTRLALGRPAPSQLVERLALDTGGNPLFLLETLRALMDFKFDTSQLQQVDPLPLASSIRALVRERLRLLDPLTRQAISAAAVLGNTFSLDIFQQAAQLEQEDTVRVLEVMEQAHLVRPLEQSSPPSYAFIHDKIREVLLFELSQARRQYLHLQAAQAMENRADLVNAAPAEIARHYEEGGDLRSAFQYWLRASDAALNQGARAEAQSAFQAAEQILNKIELQLPERFIYQLYSAWGEIACESFDSDRAEYCYAAMLRYGEQRYAPLLIGSAYSGLARVAGMRSHPRLALAHLDHAVPFLRDSGNLFEQIEAARSRAEYLNQLLRYPEAVASLEGILELLEELPDLRTRQAAADALTLLASTYLLLAEPRKAQNAARRALDIGLYFTRTTSRARALAALSTAAYLCAEFNQAMQLCSQALQLAQEAQDGSLICQLYAVRGNICIQTGHIDQAWQDAQAIHELASARHYDEMLPRAYCIQGDIWRVLRDHNAAVQAYRKGLDASHDHITSMDCLFRLGLALALNGQIENGFSFLNQAIDLTRETGLELLRFQAELTHAVVFFLSGQVEKSLELARNVHAEISRRGLRLFANDFAWLSGMALIGSNPESASRHALTLIKAGEEIEDPWVKFAGLEILLLVETEKGSAFVQHRLDELCTELSPYICNPEVQPAFAALCERIKMQAV